MSPQVRADGPLAVHIEEVLGASLRAHFACLPLTPGVAKMESRRFGRVGLSVLKEDDRRSDQSIFKLNPKPRLRLLRLMNQSNGRLTPHVWQAPRQPYPTR